MKKASTASSYTARLAPLFSRLVYNIRHFHIENKGLKLLSLLLAFLLFIVSRQPQREVLLIGVPVVYANLSSGLEISGEVPATVNVRLQGPQDVVRSILPNQIEVLADLSNKAPGHRVVQLKPTDSGPREVKVLRIEPSTIELQIEVTQRKRVQAEVPMMGQVAPGFEKYGYSVEPPTVEIEGPQSKINSVTSVLTESVSLDSRRESFQTSVDIDLHKLGVRLVQPTSLRVSVEIGEQRIERVFSDVPINLSNLPPRVHFTPQKVDVRLRGPQSLINSINAQNIKVEIPTSGLIDQAEVVTPQVSLPAERSAKIEVVEVSPKQVKVKR
ncbi:MAG TPA: CdaR family protein [Blastocatellia bacterium]|nr:CdaR family protein [Blastocatellia bacterium]